MEMKNHNVGMGPSQIFFYLIDEIGFEHTFSENQFS